MNFGWVSIEQGNKYKVLNKCRCCAYLLGAEKKDADDEEGVKPAVEFDEEVNERWYAGPSGGGGRRRGPARGPKWGRKMDTSF